MHRTFAKITRAPSNGRPSTYSIDELEELVHLVPAEQLTTLAAEIAPSSDVFLEGRLRRIQIEGVQSVLQAPHRVRLVEASTHYPLVHAVVFLPGGSEGNETHHEMVRK